MKTRLSKQKLISFLALVLLILFALPVMAQDDPTAEPLTQAPISIVTAEAPGSGDVNVTVNTPPAAETPLPTDPAEPWYAKYAAQLIALLITVGGAVYGLVKAANKWLEGRKTDVASMTLAEQGYRRSPSVVKSLAVSVIKEFIRLGGNLQEILNEVEDDTPYAMKRVAPPPSDSGRPLRSPDRDV